MTYYKPCIKTTRWRVKSQLGNIGYSEKPLKKLCVKLLLNLKTILDLRSRINWVLPM